MQLVSLREIVVHFIEYDLQESGRDFVKNFDESFSCLFPDCQIAGSQTLDHDQIDQLLQLASEELDWKLSDYLGNSNSDKASNGRRAQCLAVFLCFHSLK